MVKGRKEGWEGTGLDPDRDLEPRMGKLRCGQEHLKTWWGGSAVFFFFYCHLKRALLQTYEKSPRSVLLHGLFAPFKDFGEFGMSSQVLTDFFFSSQPPTSLSEKVTGEANKCSGGFFVHLHPKNSFRRTSGVLFIQFLFGF